MRAARKERPHPERNCPSPTSTARGSPAFAANAAPGGAETQMADTKQRQWPPHVLLHPTNRTPAAHLVSHAVRDWEP